MEDLEALPIVLIEWEDSRSPSCGWKFLSELRPAGAVLCRSIGWIVEENPEAVQLAQSLGDIGGDAAQVNGIMEIPVRCIRSRVHLAPLTQGGPRGRDATSNRQNPTPIS